MYALVVSDLHLTDRSTDEYRWKLFSQLADLSNEHGANNLFILGDLTEFKDYHSSKLVNRVVDSLYQLRRQSKITNVYVLKGNHDGLDPDMPYFKFLNKIPWCKFYIKPTEEDLGSARILFLPHTRDPEKDWKKVDFDSCDLLFFHGTVTGAISETGQKLDGIPVSFFKDLSCKVLGGDIHVPQKVAKKIEYVGAPYPIRFGDTFDPRAILIKGKEYITLPLENIRKITVTIGAGGVVREFDSVTKGDQVKLLIELRESEMGEFHELKIGAKKALDAIGAELTKVQLVKKAAKPKLKKGEEQTTEKIKASSPAEELKKFCLRNKVEKTLAELGEVLLEEEYE